MSGKKITVIIIALLALDQVVKLLVKCNMTLGESIPVFSDWFFIRFIENPGAAFGMELGGDYGKLILSLFRVIVVTFVSLYISKLIKKGVQTGVLIGFALVVAGACGNIFDSAFYGLIFSESTPTTVAQLFPAGGGYAGFLHGDVVDMLWFPIIKGVYPSWMPFVGGDNFTFFSPIFNVADAYISIGVAYLIIFQWKFLK